jgi:membrane-associated phospholipid phosphatase
MRRTRSPSWRWKLLLAGLLLAGGAGVAAARAAADGSCQTTVVDTTEPGAAEAPVRDPAAPERDRGRNPLRDGVRALHDLVTDGVHILSSPLRMTGGDALRVAGWFAASGLLLAYDEEIYEALLRNREEFPLRWILEVGRALDPVGFGRMNVYWLGGLGASYVAGWQRGVVVFAQIVESHAIAGVGKLVAQEIVGRRRPFEGEGAYSFGNSDATSFPSGHTINIFQLATILSHHVDRGWFTAAAYFGAGCLGVQRVESSNHWASDVLLSAVYGTAVAKAVIKLHEERRVTVLPHASPAGVGLQLAVAF